VITDTFSDQNFVLIGDKGESYITSFYSDEIDGTELIFTVVNDQSEIVMSDQFENKYNIFGEAISGPNQGFKLTSTDGYMGYWFAWAAFYPTITIYRP
jgi:hypothetical protein